MTIAPTSLSARMLALTFRNHSSTCVNPVTGGAGNRNLPGSSPREPIRAMDRKRASAILRGSHSGPDSPGATATPACPRPIDRT